MFEIEQIQKYNKSYKSINNNTDELLCIDFLS